MKNLLFTLISVFVFSGCSMSPTVELTPDTAHGKGILVGQVSSNSIGKEHFLWGAGLRINGKLYPYVIDRDRFALPLKPGEYELSKIEWRRQSGNVISYRKYPVKMKFEIKEGEITNLGMIVIASTKEMGNKFVVLYADNADEMEGMIRIRYPEVYGKLMKTDANAAYDRVIDQKQIELLRMSSIEGKLGGYWKDNIRWGSLGALIRKKDDGSGAATVEMIETGTTQHLYECVDSGKIIACIVDAADAFRVLVVDEDGIKTQSIADIDDLELIDISRRDEITAATRDFVVVTSIDHGKSAYTERSFRVEKLPEEYWRLMVFEGSDGVYVYGTGKGLPVLFREHGAAEVKPIDTKSLSAVKDMLETEAGIYIGPDDTKFRNSRFLFKATGSDNWVERELPATQCSTISYREGNLTASCGGLDKDEYLVSMDNGITWEVVERR